MEYIAWQGKGREKKGRTTGVAASGAQADLFRVEGLLEHCVEAVGRGLNVNTAIEQLVCAHSDVPAQARSVAAV